MTNNYITIIAGSRNITQYNLLLEAISEIDWKISIVVSGGANGVDSLGERWAKENGKDVKLFPARWNLYGRAAGMVRNRKMVEYADAAIFLWDGESKGTQNCIMLAQARNLKVYVKIINKETK